MMFSKKLLVPFAIIFLTILSFSYYLIERNVDRPEGWETEKTVQQPFKPGAMKKTVQQPFKPGAILNGQPPEAVEISLIEPKAQSPIRVKPASSCEVRVGVTISGTSSPSSDIPPTFVFLKVKKLPKSGSKPYDYVFFDNKEKSNDAVRASDSEISGSLTSSENTGKPLKGDTALSNAILRPSAKTDRTYIYSGQVVAPRKPGDYAVVLEAEYAIFDVSSGKIEPRQYRKSIMGTTLHVIN